MENLPSNKDQFTQQHIPALLAKVDAEINSIRSGLPKQSKTTGHLQGFGRIADIKTVEDLIKAHSLVVAKQKGYDASAKEILPEGIKKPPLKIDGSAPSSWIEDIKARVVLVANKTKLEKLQKVKAKLEANLSEEARLAKDLAEIADILAD